MTKKMIETSNNYRKPYRPLPIAAFNGAGSLLEKLGARPDWSGAKLGRAARKKTGLNEFGDEWFLQPLSVLVDQRGHLNENLRF